MKNNLEDLRRNESLSFNAIKLPALIKMWCEDNPVNGDADPFVPDRHRIVEHIKNGMVIFNPDNFYLYPGGVAKIGLISGHNLKNTLRDQTLYNANFLDYLLENQELIPKEWTNELIPFLGTVFTYAHLETNDKTELWYVRCLTKIGRDWTWCWMRLKDHFVGCKVLLIRTPKNI